MTDIAFPRPERASQGSGLPDPEAEARRLLELFAEELGAAGAALMREIDGAEPEMLLTCGMPVPSGRPAAAASLWQWRSPLAWDSVAGPTCPLLFHLDLTDDDPETIRVVLIYPPYGHPERHTVEAAAVRLRPFLASVVRTWQRGRAESARAQGLAAALDLADLSVLVLDQDEHLVFANARAMLLLQTGDGLQRKGHSIAATALGDALRLQQVIAETKAGRSAPFARGARYPLVTLNRRDGRRPLLATVFPARSSPAPAGATTILFVLDPDVDLRPLLQPICALYHLSAMESALLIELVGGNALDEAAAVLEIKSQTARSYLRQIFVKTGTNRQAELMRLALSSVIHASVPGR